MRTLIPRAVMNRAAMDRRVAELGAEYGSPDACPAALLCDRHRDEAVAFTVVEPDLSYRDLTFGELGELSARFAAGLAGLGVGPGDAVATLMGKSVELVVFDVESVLVTHDQVIEAAVIGVPDQLRGEVIEAFVVLRGPSEGTEELASELQQLVKDKFAAHAYPAGCISLRRCPRRPAARFSDTSFAGNVPDPLRRDTARPCQLITIFRARHTRCR